ncbi:MAG: hypothetical protein U0270_35255 [Labilithrix sp.]
MKRALAVLLLGLGMVGVATLAGRRGADERFTAARNAVDADCRAYRAQPAHRHADVCRIDHYGPKALPLRAEAKPLLEHARSALAHDDVPGAERDLSRVVAILDELDHVGTSIAQLVRASLVAEILDVAAEHRELDATRLLREVRLTKHPFAAESLQHRWYLAHWNELAISDGMRSRSAGDLAEAIVEDGAHYDAMERALVERRDVRECEEIARKHELSALMCVTLNDALDTAARLDATQHGRLSSPRR